MKVYNVNNMGQLIKCQHCKSYNCFFLLQINTRPSTWITFIFDGQICIHVQYHQYLKWLGKELWSLEKHNLAVSNYLTKAKDYNDKKKNGGHYALLILLAVL